MTAVILMGSVVFTIYHLSAIPIKKIKSIIDELPISIIYEVKLITPPAPPETKPEIKTPPPKPNTENFVPVVIDSTNDVETKEKDLKPDEVNNSKDISDTGDPGNDKPTTGTETKDIPASNEPLLPYFADKLPEFPGGESAMIKFIQKNTHIPREYLNEEISKTVFISFVVDSAGNVYEIKPEKNNEDYPKFADEAKKTVTKMPRWKPGQQHGRNVAVRMTLPVKFSVKKDF
jgi:protein TonB